MKNSIAKVIKFMRNVVDEAPSQRYTLNQGKDGKALFLDLEHRIEVAVGVDEIVIKQYANTEDKNLVENCTLLWEELTTKQKTQIIEILDDTGDGEPDERDEIIERIFK